MEREQYKYSVFHGTMTEDEYEKLIDMLEKHKPKRICELGSGQSTLIFEQYCAEYGAKLFSIEHNAIYRRESTILFPLIDEESEICIGDTAYRSCNRYDGFEDWLMLEGKFDFVLVDGPFGFGDREEKGLSRVHLLSFVILDKLSDSCVVMFHDSQRKNAKDTLKEFERLLSERGFDHTKEVIDTWPELTIYEIRQKILH